MIDYKFRIDLQSERTIYTHTELTTGDAYAYRFWFSFYSDGQPYDISDCMLTVKAKRADGVVLTDAGSRQRGRSGRSGKKRDSRDRPL